MRFLVVATPKVSPPPEMLPQLIDGAEQWQQRYEDKLEAFGVFPAGGGFGIVEVADSGELHRMLLEMPFSPFADHMIQPIVDGETSWRQSREIFAAMAGAA
jgi:muconolactone delta-isomerase